MSTLGHQYDNSLVSNAFGFLRLPMNFQPYDSDADWVITGVPFDMATSGPVSYTHLDVYKRQGRNDVFPLYAAGTVFIFSHLIAARFPTRAS